MNKIGIALSGGVESTILAALFSMHYNDVTCYTQYDHIVNKDRIKSITQYLNLKDSIFISEDMYRSAPTYLGHIVNARRDVDVIYFGDTLVMEEDSGVKRLSKDELVAIEKNTICRFPFYSLSKPEVMYIGKTLIPEFDVLFNMTRSCSEGREGECGWCFHCKERSWALEEIS